MQYISTANTASGEQVIVAIPLAHLPGFDPANPHPFTYAVGDEVQVGWVKSGSTFVPPTPVVLIPQSVTRRQFKLALLNIGLLDNIESVIAASTDRALQINWTEALDFRRDNPFVASMATALGKSEAEIDALFIAAAAITQ